MTTDRHVGIGRARLSPATLDVLVVVVIVLLSVLPYLSRIGFYSDDWAFLGIMSTAEDQSVGGLVGTLFDFHANLRVRPLQIGYQAGLFSLFGLEPVGYHVVNALVLTAMTVLFYLVLRELRLPRLVAVAVPVVFALMPNYATNRFWFASFGYVLTFALYFLSLYADMRGLRSAGRRLMAWKALALLALVAGALGYEIVLPFFALSPVLVWLRGRALWDGGLFARLSRARAGLYVLSPYAMLLGIVVYKLTVGPETGIGRSFLSHLARLVVGSSTTHFGTYGAGLPQAAWWGIRNAGPIAIGVAAVLGLIVFGYTSHVVRREQSFPQKTTWLRLGGVGLVIFALGHVMFLTTSRFGFSSSGINNRTTMGAALGLAMLWVAVAGWVGCLATRPLVRRLAFPAAITAVSVSGFLIIGGLASSWATAWPHQQEILATIHYNVPNIAPRTTLILHGVCPYEGPAVVFESPWDLAGALQAVYADPTLKADVNTPRLTVLEEGIRTTMYGGDDATLYPFDGRVLMFDPEDESLRELQDARTASLRLTDNPVDCPEGQPGRGVTVFPLDQLYKRWEART